jgi:hypothetical protein
MRARIARYRRAAPEDRGDFAVGCRVLTQPFLLAEKDWLPIPAGWSPNIVSFKAGHCGKKRRSRSVGRWLAPLPAGAHRRTRAAVAASGEDARMAASGRPWVLGLTLLALLAAGEARAAEAGAKPIG